MCLSSVSSGNQKPAQRSERKSIGSYLIYNLNIGCQEFILDRRLPMHPKKGQTTYAGKSQQLKKTALPNMSTWSGWKKEPENLGPVHTGTGVDDATEVDQSPNSQHRTKTPKPQSCLGSTDLEPPPPLRSAREKKKDPQWVGNHCDTRVLQDGSWVDVSILLVCGRSSGLHSDART